MRRRFSILCWQLQFWPQRIRYAVAHAPARAWRPVAQLWWRLFGEKCPCGQTYRRKTGKKFWSRCCAVAVIANLIDKAFEEERGDQEPIYARYLKEPSV